MGAGWSGPQLREAKGTGDAESSPAGMSWSRSSLRAPIAYPAVARSRCEPTSMQIAAPVVALPALSQVTREIDRVETGSVVSGEGIFMMRHGLYLAPYPQTNALLALAISRAADDFFTNREIIRPARCIS